MLMYAIVTVPLKNGLRRKSSELPGSTVYRTPNKWKLPVISDVGSDAEDDDGVAAETSLT